MVTNDSNISKVKHNIICRNKKKKNTATNNNNNDQDDDEKNITKIVPNLNLNLIELINGNRS